MNSIGSFGGYLTQDYPSHIVVDVTEFCNLACVHCPFVSVTKPKGKARHQLAPELHKKLAQDVAKDGKKSCRFVRYSGEGEPLLHPHIIEFLSEMSAVGAQTSLTSNGLLLTQERCEAIVAAGTSAVDISIDAFKPETYAKIRVGGDFETMQAGVKRLIAAKRAANSPLKIMTSFIHQEGNEGEDEDFKAYWQDQGADLVFIRDLHSCAGHQKELAQKMWAAAPKPRTPCLYPWERLNLKADGFVHFCPADWEHGSRVGDFRKQTMAEIWQSPEMEAVRQAHVTNDFSAHSFCGQCPDWSVIRWPWQGRTYASAMHEFDED